MPTHVNLHVAVVLLLQTSLNVLPLPLLKPRLLLLPLSAAPQGLVQFAHQHLEGVALPGVLPVGGLEPGYDVVQINSIRIFLLLYVLCW